MQGGGLGIFDVMPPIAPPSSERQPSDAPDRAFAGSVALDQWRGLALILVLLSHAFFFTNHVNGVGRIGVNLFFFISGILVYRSLGKSRQPPWRRAKSFWWRRFRRLYPGLAAYLAALLGLILLLQILPHPPPNANVKSYFHTLPWALTFSINYGPEDRMSTGLWSLACEMQFYLSAPAVIFLGEKFRRGSTFFYGLLALALIAFGISYPLRAAHLDSAKYHFEVAVWPMMLGFFCESARGWFLKWPLLLAKTLFATGVASLILACALMFFGLETKKLVIAVGGASLFPCLFAYLFGWPIAGRPGKSFRWIGERTYSIYLWQQPLTVGNFLPPSLQPPGAILAVSIGALWFRLFEKPFLSSTRTATLDVGVASPQQPTVETSI